MGFALADGSFEISYLSMVAGAVSSRLPGAAIVASI